jgi:hypothetical protein
VCGWSSPSTQHPAAACERIFVELSCRVVVAELVQVVGEVVRGAQRVRVVVPLEASSPGEGVLVQFPCPLGVAELVHVVGEIASSAQRV